MALASPAVARLDTLGEPTIPIASGTDVIAAGTGLCQELPLPCSGQGLIEFVVPENVVIKQVLLYWSGLINGTATQNAGAISVNGQDVSGDLVGGPTLFWSNVHSVSFRADITTSGLVDIGSNALEIANASFSYQPSGAGVIVIVEDPLAAGEFLITVRDGNDVCFREFPELRGRTEIQHIGLVGSLQSREMKVSLLVADMQANENRSTVINVKVRNGMGVELLTEEIPCALGGHDGSSWDTFYQGGFPLAPGSVRVSISIDSRTYFDTGCTYQPGSFAWVAMAAVIPRSLYMDCNGNSVPDICDLDCGVHPDCTEFGISCGESFDCNSNGVLDECDIAAGTSADCDQNAIPDACDIAAGSAADCNTNGVLDECEVLAPIQPFEWMAEWGLWSDDANWCPAHAPNNQGGVVYDAVLRGALAAISLDVPVMLQSLYLIGGATVMAGDGGSGRTAGGAALTADQIFNDGVIEAVDGETLTLAGDILQSTNGIIRAVGPGSTVILEGLDTRVIGGTIAAVADGVIRLAGSRVQQLLLQDSGGAGIFLSSNGTVAVATVETLSVTDGQRGLLEGIIDNIGTISVKATTSATSLVTVPDTVELRGTGELVMIEEPAVSLARANLGDIATRLINSNGHTIRGTGRIDASEFINAGLVQAVGSSRPISILAGTTTNLGSGIMDVQPGGRLILLGDVLTEVDNTGAILVGEKAALTFVGDVARNFGRIDAADRASLFFLGDFTSSSIEAGESRITVTGNARIEMDGSTTLNELTTYYTTNGADSVQASLTTENLFVTSEFSGGGRMFLTDEMRVKVYDQSRIVGHPCSDESRGLIPPPIIKLRGSADLDTYTLDVLRSGILDVADHAFVYVHSLLHITSNGELISTNGSRAFILAGAVDILGAPLCGGRLLLAGDATMSVYLDFRMLAEPGQPPREHIPPIWKVRDSALVTIGGNLDLLGMPGIEVSSTAAVQLGGNFNNESVDEASFDWASGALRLTGSALRTFEVAGEDRDAAATGFISNFAMGAVEIDANAKVTFVNQLANVNSSGACAEALYVGRLHLGSGADVTLDNVRVYSTQIIDEGANIHTNGCGELIFLPAGDYDGNGACDLIDHAAFVDCLDEPSPYALRCRVFDFDCDGDLDLADFAEFMRRFGGSASEFVMGCGEQ